MLCRELPSSAQLPLSPRFGMTFQSERQQADNSSYGITKSFFHHIECAAHGLDIAGTLHLQLVTYATYEKYNPMDYEEVGAVLAARRYLVPETAVYVGDLVW